MVVLTSEPAARVPLFPRYFSNAKNSSWLCRVLSPRRKFLTAAATSAEILIPVKECLEKMKSTIPVESFASDTCITITGKQWFLEMEGEYKFTWCLDGRFHEQFQGDDFTVEWAHDGEKTWYADFAGRVTNLKLDNLESCILTTWIRNGYWLTEQGQSKLSIENGTDLLDPPIFKQPQMQILKLQLKNYNKVTGYVLIDTQTFLPIRLIIKKCGSMDTWEFSDWKVLKDNWKVPFSVSQLTTSGSMNSIFITSCTVHPVATKEDSATFKMPSSPVKPRKNIYPQAEFDSTISPHVNMVVSESGHCLIQPKVDGHEFGYFILDTGASGLSIGAEYSKTLSMDAFGEVFLRGIESRVRSRFVRGKTFQIGSLKLLNPLYMECSLRSDGVKESTPVVGICGFDLFFYCIAEINMSKELLSIFNPSSYTSSYNLNWQTMDLLNNVPHVQASINGQKTALLLDIGAGGIDVILNARAGKDLGLDKCSESSKHAKMEGTDEGLQAQSEDLESLHVGGLEFDKPKCMLLPAGDLDVSYYSSGLLCGDLLKSSVVVTDYQNSRFALVKPS